MALSDMVVFNEELYTSVYETTDQLIEKFNAASNGTILLTTMASMGDHASKAFWKNLDTATGRRNVYGSGVVAPTNLEQGEEVSVKVAGRVGPIAWNNSQLSWIRRSPAEALQIISLAVSQAIMKDQLNTGILSAVSALGNNAAIVEDVSGTGSITQSTVNNGLAKFGDMSGTISALIMTANQYHRLIGEAITNANNLFEVGGVAVREGSAFGQGRPIIVTDAPALRESGAPNKQKVLGLVSGGIVISDNSDYDQNIDKTNGDENIKSTFQAEYTFNSALKGYSWDKTIKSPTDAQLGTGTNWTKIAAFDKNTAGVQIIGQE